MNDLRIKTHAQLQRIFGLAKPLGCTKEDLENLAFELTNGRVERLSTLTFREANAMIERLGGSPLSQTPGRTLRHRRQKAGVPQIASHAQLEFLRKLAEARGITDDGFERLCRRMLRGQPRPRTTAEANKIIEAIKAMNRRDDKAHAA